MIEENRDQAVEVSVSLLTYDHEKYIRECLDSILMQKTSFRFEVLVGDDASSDGTQAILRDYQDRYPDVFKMVLRTQNLGPNRNSYDLLKQARGKYIAHLEGDDYWTDENKLQIQYEFMEKHPEYAECTHAVQIVDAEGKKSTKKMAFPPAGTVVRAEAWHAQYDPGHILSSFHRNYYMDETHDYTILYRAHPFVGDHTSHLLSLLNGDIFYLGRCMGAYRFVNVPGANNAVSILHNNPDYPRQVVDYWSSLEEYAKSEFGRGDVEFANCKFAWYKKHVDALIRHPGISNWKRLFYMAKRGGEPGRYLGYAFGLIGEKILKQLKRPFCWVRRKLHQDVLDEIMGTKQMVKALQNAVAKLDRQTAAILRKLDPPPVLPANSSYSAEQELEMFLSKHQLPALPKRGCMIDETERIQLWNKYNK